MRIMLNTTSRNHQVHHHRYIMRANDICARHHKHMRASFLLIYGKRGITDDKFKEITATPGNTIPITFGDTFRMPTVIGSSQGYTSAYSGIPCVLLFLYEGEHHYQCTDKGQTGLWCGATSSYDAKTSADQVAELDACKGQGGTGQGEHDPDVATFKRNFDTVQYSSPALPPDDVTSFLLIDGEMGDKATISVTLGDTLGIPPATWQGETGQGEHDPDVAMLVCDSDTAGCSLPALPPDDVTSFLLIDGERDVKIIINDMTQGHDGLLQRLAEDPDFATLESGDGCVSRDKFVESERSDDAFEGITAAPRNTNSVTRTFLNIIFIRHAADRLSMPSESFRFPNPLQTAQAITPRRDYFASAITILLLGMSLCVIMFRKRKNVCNVRNVCIAIFFYGLLPTIDQWGASASKPRSWLSKNAMSSGQAPIPRQGYGLALVDANVFLHGGHTGADYATLNDMYVLSPENKLWTDITDLVTGDVPLPRSYFGFVPVGDAIFLFGGYRCNQCNMYDDLFKFWPSAMRWDKLSPSGSRPGGRSQAAYGSLGTKMYMHGGLGCGGTGFPCPRNDLWVFDTQSNTWTHLGNPGARAEHSMIIYRESLYLVGGILPSSCSFWFECQYAVPKSWRYDLGTKSWETMEHELYRRGVNVAVMSGKFYFIGGTGYTIPLLDDRYYYPASDEANLEFDVETNVQRAIPDTYGTYVSGAMKTSKFFHCPLLKKVLFLSLCWVDFFIPFSPLLTQLWF